MFEDAEEALAGVAARRRLCAFGRWLRTLDEGDRVRAAELVANREYNSRQLAAYFQSKGAKANGQVVYRHRNGVCCGQGE